MQQEIIEEQNEVIPDNKQSPDKDKLLQQASINNSPNKPRKPSVYNYTSDLSQSNYSEVISKEIINKLVSLVFTEKYRQEMDTKLPDCCSEYVFKSIQPCLNQEYIAYDLCKEEDEERELNSNNNLFFNNKFVDNNTWIEIKEPPKPNIERDASTLMKHKRANEEEEKKYVVKRNSTLIEMTPVLTEHSVKEDQSKMIKGSKFNLNKKYELSARPKEDQNLKKLKKDLNPLLLKVNSSRLNKGNVSDKKGEEPQEETIRTNNNDGVDKNKVIVLESHELPSKLFANNHITEEQLKEYEEMRKERVIEIARREEEEKRRKEQEKKEMVSAVAVKYIREIDTQRLTFDLNGKLMPLRLPKIDALGNEFWWSKQMIKDLAVFPNEIPKEKPSSSPQKKDPKGQKDNKSPTNKDNNKRRARNSSQAVNSSLSDINTLQSNGVEYNIDINEKYQQRYSKFSSKKLNQPILPAGNNMNLISPEVGVIISDGLQKKEGSMEFSTKFNKPSMEEFSRIALESMNININSSKQYLLSSSNSNANNNKLDDSSHYIGYAEKFHSSNNPLIQNAQSSLNAVDYIRRKDSGKNRLLTSENPLMMNSNSRQFKSQNLEGILLGKQLQTNLKTAIDLVEDTNGNMNLNINMMSADLNNNNRMKTKIFSNEDFIRERPKKSIDLYKHPEMLDYNMINSFNSNIIKSKDWGSSRLYADTNVYHRRPVKSNHVKELGLRIVTTKLQRDRRLNSGKEIINSIR